MPSILRACHPLHFVALSSITMLTPATYTAAVRTGIAQAMCQAVWPVLPGYTLISLLLGIVTTHVIATAAAGYGLTHLALEAVVRVIVVELIPLAAALFVAFRSGSMLLDRLAAARLQGKMPDDRILFTRFVLPDALAHLFAVVFLTVLSGILVLIMAYPVIHGFTLYGLPSYTRLIGQVFDPLTASIVFLKMLLFGAAVGFSPATLLCDTRQQIAGKGAVRVMARLFFALALIEIALLLLLHS